MASSGFSESFCGVGLGVLGATLTSPVPSPSSFLSLILCLILFSNTLSLPLRPYCVPLLLSPIFCLVSSSMPIATYNLDNWTLEIICLIS